MASKTAAEVQASTPANEQGPSGNPVDFEHLARYTLGEPELEREVLGLFSSPMRTGSRPPIPSKVPPARLAPGAWRKPQNRPKPFKAMV
jgi:hypothetical protein